MVLAFSVFVRIENMRKTSAWLLEREQRTPNMRGYEREQKPRSAAQFHNIPVDNNGNSKRLYTLLLFLFILDVCIYDLFLLRAAAAAAYAVVDAVAAAY